MLLVVTIFLFVFRGDGKYGSREEPQGEEPKNQNLRAN